MAYVECPFSADVIHLDGSAVIAVGGELDIATAPVLRGAVTELLNPHLHGVTLDLHDLTFVDVAGLRAVVDLQELTNGPGTSFQLRNVSDLTVRVIRSAGFEHLLEFVEPEEPAPLAAGQLDAVKDAAVSRSGDSDV